MRTYEDEDHEYFYFRSLHRWTVNMSKRGTLVIMNNIFNLYFTPLFACHIVDDNFSTTPVSC